MDSRKRLRTPSGGNAASIAAAWTLSRSPRLGRFEAVLTRPSSVADDRCLPVFENPQSLRGGRVRRFSRNGCRPLADIDHRQRYAQRPSPNSPRKLT